MFPALYQPWTTLYHQFGAPRTAYGLICPIYGMFRLFLAINTTQFGGTTRDKSGAPPSTTRQVHWVQKFHQNQKFIWPPLPLTHCASRFLARTNHYWKDQTDKKVPLNAHYCESILKCNRSVCHVQISRLQQLRFCLRGSCFIQRHEFNLIALNMYHRKVSSCLLVDLI